MLADSGSYCESGYGIVHWVNYILLVALSYFGKHVCCATSDKVQNARERGKKKEKQNPGLQILLDEVGAW